MSAEQSTAVATVPKQSIEQILLQRVEPSAIMRPPLQQGQNLNSGDLYIGMFRFLAIFALTLLGAAQSPSEIKEGSLVFVSGGNTFVQLYTGSQYSHVAIIFKDSGRYWVYESNENLGVRKIPLAEVLKGTYPEGVRVWITQPKKAYTPEQIERMHQYVQSQLGRPYSVWSYWYGIEQQGIHCSELVAKTLMYVNITILDNPCLVSPGDIFTSLIGSVYDSLLSRTEFSLICQMPLLPYLTQLPTQLHFFP